MGIEEKVVKAIRTALPDAYVRVESDDGLSGYAISNQFKSMSTLDRQGLIDDALRNAEEPLTPEEYRQVLMIAALTPEEADSAGSRIRVQKVKEMAGGTFEILLHGRMADAEYVRSALNHQKGMKTTPPKDSPGASGILISFRAMGSPANPLTKTKVVSALKGDPYIEVMPNA